MKWLCLAFAAAALMIAAPAAAQSVGGNASIAATTSSANVQLPASTANYPVVLLEYALGATNELFYNFGTSNAVTAANTNPALPSAGICLAVGPNTWIAAIAGAATATLRITQMSTCPPR